MGEKYLGERSVPSQIMIGDPDGFPRPSFLKGVDGVIFLIGCILLLVELVIVFSFFSEIPGLRKQLISVIGADLIGGRGASISLGLDMGLSPFSVSLISIFFNLTLLFIAYPLVVCFYEKLIETRLLGKALRFSHRIAEKNQEKVRRWGPLAIGFFVWIPIYSTGALVGAIIGRLIGMRSVTVIPATVLAMAASAISWAYAFDYLFRVAEKTGKILPSLFVAVIFGIALVLRFSRASRKRSTKL